MCMKIYIYTYIFRRYIKIIITEENSFGLENAISLMYMHLAEYLA